MTKKRRRLLATKKAEQQLKRETWSLDSSVTNYLYIHLLAYRRYAGPVINLAYHRFDYENNNYGLDELIDLMIELCVKMQSIQDSYKAEDMIAYRDYCKQLCDILGMTLPYLWW